MDGNINENPHEWVSESFSERLNEVFFTRDVMDRRVRNFFFNRHKVKAEVIGESEDGNYIVVDLGSNKDIVTDFLERLPPRTELQKIDEYPNRKSTPNLKLTIDWSGTQWDDQQVHDMKLDLIAEGLGWPKLEKEILRKYLEDAKEKGKDMPIVCLHILITKWA